MSDNGENIVPCTMGFIPGGIKKHEFSAKRKYLKGRLKYFHETFIKAFTDLTKLASENPC